MISIFISISAARNTSLLNSLYHTPTGDCNTCEIVWFVLSLRIPAEELKRLKMMVSVGSAKFCCKQMGSNLCIVTPILESVSSSRHNFRRVISWPRGKIKAPNFRGRTDRGRIFCNSEGVYSVASRRGRWEDPDYCSGSEYDEESKEEDAEEDDLDFESDWEPENSAASRVNIVDHLSESKEEEDFVKEVEQLLSPEERAILHTNETPCLEKISTVKWKPFHTFALAGQIKFMDMLLENGLDVDQVDKDGRTALHHAIIGKKEAVISHLLRKGANPHLGDLNGVTPLHYAVQVGAMQTVKLLIKYNVDVNAADNEGWTALHIAMQSRNRYIAKILLVNGADKTRRNKDGNTPLDLSLCYGKDFKSYELAKLLKMVPAYREL